MAGTQQGSQTSNHFPIGSLVVLKSGGPIMTVTAIIEDGKCRCEWFDLNHKVQFHVFYPLALEEPSEEMKFVAQM